MGPKADQLRALREAKLTGKISPRLGTEKLRKIVETKASMKTKPKASAAGQPKENPMMTFNSTNATAQSRPRTLAEQTPREQVDEILAKTAAGTMPPPPPFLDQTAGKTPEQLKAIIAENAKKGAKARATGPKLKATRTTAPMLPKNIEPAGKAILKEQTKMKTKAKNEKKAAKEVAAPKKVPTPAKTTAKPARQAPVAPKPKAATKPPVAGERADGLRAGSKLAKMLDFAAAAPRTEPEICKHIGGWAHCSATLGRVCKRVGAKMERKDGRFYVTLKKAA